MESGSHTALGGAVVAAYQLYSGLKKFKGYKLDLFGNFAHIDKKVRPVSVEQMLSTEYDIIILNSIRDVILADRYMALHKKTKAIYVDRSNTLLNYKTENLGGALSDTTTSILSLSPVEWLVSERILDLSFEMWKKHMKKKEAVTSSLSSMAITFEEVVKRYLITRMKKWLSYYIAITTDQERYAKKFFRGKIKVAYVPIAQDKIFRRLNLKRRFSGAMYEGRLDERQKKLNFMIKGIDRVRDGQIEHLENKKLLKIVGKGPHEQQYKELVKQLGLEKNIVFKPPVYGQALVKEYNDAEFYVSTSEWESPGRMFLVAMACGLPVLNNTKNNTNGLIKNEYNGMVYKYNDIEDFAEKFYFLYTNKKYRERLAVNALKESKNYSIDKTLALYKKIVDGL